MESALPEGAWVAAMDGWMAGDVHGPHGPHGYRMAWHVVRGGIVTSGGGRAGMRIWTCHAADSVEADDVAARVALRPGPGRVRKPAGRQATLNREPCSDATLHSLDIRSAFKTFGLGNVRA